MSDKTYTKGYKDIDFRKHPEAYFIGRGEQGVLIAEPYKSELLPYWKFKNPPAAKLSAKTLYQKFVAYRKQRDFVGMDMARKFLQMGFTRARRYANHPSGTKYNQHGDIHPQAADWKDSEKAKSAQIFYEYYVKAREDNVYKRLKAKHTNRAKRS